MEEGKRGDQLQQLPRQGERAVFGRAEGPAALSGGYVDPGRQPCRHHQGHLRPSFGEQNRDVGFIHGGKLGPQSGSGGRPSAVGSPRGVQALPTGDRPINHGQLLGTK